MSMFCDNETNFVGARNQLQEVKESFHSELAQKTIIPQCSEKVIDFQLIPSRTSHFGGFWEAAKVVKVC